MAGKQKFRYEQVAPGHYVIEGGQSAVQDYMDSFFAQGYKIVPGSGQISKYERRVEMYHPETQTFVQENGYAAH